MGLIHLLCQSYHFLDKSNTILRPLRKLEPAILQRLVTGALVRCLLDSNYQSAIRACTKLQEHARVKSQPMLDELKEICTTNKKKRKSTSTPEKESPAVTTAVAVSSKSNTTTIEKNNKKTPTAVIPSLSDILSLSSYQKSKLAKVPNGVLISFFFLLLLWSDIFLKKSRRQLKFINKRKRRKEKRKRKKTKMRKRRRIKKRKQRATKRKSN